MIEEWNCAACGLNYLWVKSHWRDGFLESARAVVLSEAELLETDYMTDMWFDLRQKGKFYADFTDIQPAELRRILAIADLALWEYRRAEGLLGDGWHAKTVR